MTPADNAQLITDYLARIWNARALDETADFVADDYESGVLPTRGPDAARQLVEGFAASFPDFEVTIEDTVSEGDRVVVRYAFQGTHRGEWMGVAPTERRVAIEGITLYRLDAGKIVRTWFSYDALGLLQQLRDEA